MSIAPVIARSLSFKVVVKSTGQQFEFNKPLVTIGRGLENDIVFQDDTKVSRQHAEIKNYLGQLYIRNSNPKNFILVNGERVEERIIESSCTLQIGEQSLEIQYEPPPAVVKVAPAPLLQPVPSIVNKSTVLAKKSRSLAQAKRPASSQRPEFQQTNVPPPSYKDMPRAASGGGGRTMLYLIVAIIGAGLYWLFAESNANRVSQKLRSESMALQEIQATDERIEELEKSKAGRAEDTIQFKTAELHYIKGFRDYRNGQYARAIQSFQAALSFFPQHELALKYRGLATRKFDEQIQQNMMVGLRYKGKGNYRLCQSSFASAMIMLKDPNDRKYVESKKYYDECRLLGEAQ